MRSDPRWPAIFLFLKVLPGSWRLPVEPCERWLIETPCDASRPAKFHRFIAPAKPLPLLMPVTSTFWPVTKCAALSFAPRLDHRIGAHPELDKLQRRLDAGLGKVAAVRAGHVLRLGPADAELEGVVAILLGVAAGDNTHLIQMQDSHGNRAAVIIE